MRANTGRCLWYPDRLQRAPSSHTAESEKLPLPVLPRHPRSRFNFLGHRRTTETTQQLIKHKLQNPKKQSTTAFKNKKAL
jgi:hypothetical protein